MKKAIIIGASSGIGEELARQLCAKGYVLGLTARREDRLKSLQKELSGEVHIQKMDVSSAQETQGQFKHLIEKMDGADLVIISAGTGFLNPDLEPNKELDTIKTNVSGFTLIADLAFSHFKESGFGHLVGISSIAALRGGHDAPAYNASKAYVSNYLQGLRQKAAKENLDITVTDIQPGFVDTAMAQGDGLFWVAPVPKAAAQILDAVEKKKAHAYVTSRWRLVAWLIRCLPDCLYNKL